MPDLAYKITADFSQAIEEARAYANALAEAREQAQGLASASGNVRGAGSATVPFGTAGASVPRPAPVTPQGAPVAPIAAVSPAVVDSVAATASAYERATAQAQSFDAALKRQIEDARTAAVANEQLAQRVADASAQWSKYTRVVSDPLTGKPALGAVGKLGQAGEGEGSTLGGMGAADFNQSMILSQLPGPLGGLAGAAKFAGPEAMAGTVALQASVDAINSLVSGISAYTKELVNTGAAYEQARVNATAYYGSVSAGDAALRRQNDQLLHTGTTLQDLGQRFGEIRDESERAFSTPVLAEAETILDHIATTLTGMKIPDLESKLGTGLAEVLRTSVNANVQVANGAAGIANMFGAHITPLKELPTLAESMAEQERAIADDAARANNSLQSQVDTLSRQNQLLDRQVSMSQALNGLRASAQTVSKEQALSIDVYSQAGQQAALALPGDMANYANQAIDYSRMQAENYTEDQIYAMQRAASMGVPYYPASSQGSAYSKIEAPHSLNTRLAGTAVYPTAGRAGGGPVYAGQTYTVGEHGPETLQMGNQSGTIVPGGGGYNASQMVGFCPGCGEKFMLNHLSNNPRVGDAVTKAVARRIGH